MSVGDVAVYLVAAVALAILAFGIIRGLIPNWRDIPSVLGITAVIGAIGGVGFLVLGAVIYVGVIAYGQNLRSTDDAAMFDGARAAGESSSRV